MNGLLADQTQTNRLERGRKVGWIISVAAIVAVLLMGCSGTSGTKPSNVPQEPVVSTTTAAVQEAAPASAPDMTGVRLDKAQHDLEDAGFKVIYEDSYLDRTIMARSNWVVTEQRVSGDTVTLGAMKYSDPGGSSVEGNEQPAVQALNTVGFRLDKAQHDLENAGYKVIYEDSYLDRIIMARSNWVVTEQRVSGHTVTLGAMKYSDPGAPPYQ